MKKSGLITLGEALIDFIPLDTTNTSYQKSPGGAPANVAVGAARLGMKSTFVGKLGNDVLGGFLRTTLKGFGVDVSSIRLTSDYRTGLVFVTLASDGERSFSFYIDPSADMFLDETEIEENVFKENKVFHFGTISLLMDPVRSATKKAISYAKKHGMIVSFDPNVRLSLWKDEALLKETIFNMLPDVDVLKISTEELDFLTGSEDTGIIDNWMTKYGLSLIFLTKGAEGSTVFTKSGAVEVKALKVNTIDTTGAGDAFVSGFLYCLNEREQDLSTISVEEAAEIAEFASVSGALAAAQKGAMTALPTLPEVKKMLSEDGSRS